MRNAMFLLMFLVLTLSAPLAGCKQTGVAGFASSSMVPEIPAPGLATVYFYRNHEPYARMQEPIYVHAGDVAVGRIMPGTFVAVDVPPGDHHFWAARSEKSYVDLELDPGEISFVRLATKQGLFVDQPVMVPTMPETAISRIKALQRVE